MLGKALSTQGSPRAWVYLLQPAVEVLRQTRWNRGCTLWHTHIEAQYHSTQIHASSEEGFLPSTPQGLSMMLYYPAEEPTANRLKEPGQGMAAVRLSFPAFSRVKTDLQHPSLHQCLGYVHVNLSANTDAPRTPKPAYHQPWVLLLCSVLFTGDLVWVKCFPGC